MVSMRSFRIMSWATRSSRLDRSAVGPIACELAVAARSAAPMPIAAPRATRTSRYENPVVPLPAPCLNDPGPDLQARPRPTARQPFGILTQDRLLAQLDYEGAGKRIVSIRHAHPDDHLQIVRPVGREVRPGGFPDHIGGRRK